MHEMKTADGMTKQEILDSLMAFSEDFPRAAIKEVQANRADFTDELLESLDYACRNAKELCNEDSDYYLHIYSMYLLAEFREKRAFPYLIEFLRLPEKHIDFIMGDILTEEFHRILLCVFDNENMEKLPDIIEDPQLYEWARISALRAYELLYKEGFETQERYVSYLRSLIYEKLPRDDFYIFTAISGSVIDSRLYQMIPDVRFLYDDDRVDLSMHGSYDSFIDWIFYEKKWKKPHYMDDAAAEMVKWACFRREPERSPKQSGESFADFSIDDIKKDRTQDQIVTQKQKKTGRNDPCPCGSGKKYKKCCIDLYQESAPVIRQEDEYDLLEEYPQNSPLFKEMYEEEAISIDMLVYKALHHRAIPIWVERDRKRERQETINYLNEALDLFLNKCQREQITSFDAYDERYMVHYRSSEWIKALLDLTDHRTKLKTTDIGTKAADTYRSFTKKPDQ